MLRRPTRSNRTDTLVPYTTRVRSDLSVRNDIIKTMHRAMTRDGGRFDPSALALHSKTPSDPIVGRLVERGLQDELAGSAYAIVDGTDGRTHHLRFDDMDMTGDARPGSSEERRVGKECGSTCRYGW